MNFDSLWTQQSVIRARFFALLPDADRDAILGDSEQVICHTLPMDWKLFVSTFVAIFAAELGDKTQLATLSLAAGTASRWTIFAGSALALVATSAVAVLLGDKIAQWIPPVWIDRAAGIIFIIMGSLFLLQSAAKQG